jgi:bifunctional UDP-N-acetylglucosamine pyrophosphorylase/glucosamine-1-phosphate N-acetyltransferase
VNLTDAPSGPAAVIILAAGQGTRMRSEVPKVLHRLGGLAMIGHALRTARALHPGRIVAVVRHQRDLVADEVLRLCPEALIADQDEVPGTGRAVQCGLRALNGAEAEPASPGGTVLVTSGDVPLLGADTLKRLVELHDRGRHAVSLVTTIAPDPAGYGRIVRDAATGSPAAIVEQRDATPAQRAITEVNAGIYAFDAAFLARALTQVGRSNDQGEVYLTDVVAAAVGAGRSVGALALDDPWEAAGCNDRLQLAQLAAELNRRTCAAHMRAGVTIVDPASTWIDVDVRIGRDTTVHPGTCLRGATRVGPRCEIGPMTTLTDVEVGEGSTLPATWGAGARVPADTMGEPFGVIGRN